MGLVERLDRRAEIERLLTENAGRLLRGSQLPPRPTPEERGKSLEQLIPHCRRLTNGDQTLLIAESVVSVFTREDGEHPRGYKFTPSPTQNFPFVEKDAGPECLARLADALFMLSGDEELRGIAIEKFAFVDTETTGIAGPSGTYAFLIGLGYFRGVAQTCEFVTEQYFMEDYCHEPAMLAHFAERLAQFDALVTYNGKTFDIPLLRGRFILNRMRTNLELPHLDLLHPARRIFKPRLGGCSLGNLELEILGIARAHDVNGRMIPSIYFDFVRGMRLYDMVPVFDHHVQDIISMGALMLHLAALVADSSHPALEHAQDLAALGRLHLRRGRLASAAEFHERALLLAREPDLTRMVLRSLAGVYKKSKRFEEAAEIWQSETLRTRATDIEPFVELAKICEHRLRDLPAALSAVESAEKQLSFTRDLSAYISEDLSAQEKELDSALARRKARLQRRIAK